MKEGGGGNGGDGGVVELLWFVRGLHTGYPHLRGRWLLGLMTGWGLQILEAGVALSHPGALHQ